MNKLVYIGVILALIFSVIALTKPVDVPFAGTTHFSGPVDSAAGYTESGTTVISTSKALSNITTGAFSSNVTVGGTLGITGESNLDTLIQGGDVTAVTATTNYTLTAAQVCDSSVITVTVNAKTGKNVTFPATTTLFADCLTTNGDAKALLFRNITATAGTTTTMVAGSGIDLLEPDGQNVVLAGGADALITVHRISTNEATIVVDEFIDAD